MLHFNPGLFNQRLFNHELFNPALDFSRIGKFIFEKSGIEKSVAEMSVIDAINTYISQPPAYHGINVIILNQDCPFFGIRHDIIVLQDISTPVFSAMNFSTPL